MSCYEFEGKRPLIDHNAFVHPEAVFNCTCFVTSLYPKIITGGRYE